MTAAGVVSGMHGVVLGADGVVSGMGGAVLGTDGVVLESPDELGPDPVGGLA